MELSANRCLLAGIIVLLLASSSAADDLGQKSYWLSKHKEVREGVLVDRAHAVFHRVLSAADKRPGFEPSFHIIEFDNIPWAQSLADGTILMTRNALEFCYRGRSLEDGDSRIAFVVGHELAHIYNRDFWKYQFLQTVAGDKEGSREFQEIRAAAMNPDVQLARELQADQYGIVYASLAGFDSDIIVTEQKSFFHQWAEKTILADDARKKMISLLDKREKVVTLRLRETSMKVGLFKLGVLSFYIGRPDDALLLFQRFAGFFPSREVFSNIGTVLLSKAYREILLNRKSDSLPYVLSFGVENVTRAELIDVGRKFTNEKGGDTERNIKESIENLQKAVAYDQTYASAKNSLGCARILEKKYYDAISLLEEALKLAPEDEGILGNLAVAYILLGEEVDSKRLEAKGEEILKSHGGQNPEARANWEAYRRWKGMSVDTPETTTFDGTPPVFLPPRNIPYPLRPGMRIPKKNALVLVDEIRDRDSVTAVYADTDRNVVLMAHDGKVRLVLYREPPVIERKENRGEKGSVVVSRSKRNGCVFEGKRPKEYFEF